jgi:hypothetical protein
MGQVGKCDPEANRFPRQRDLPVVLSRPVEFVGLSVAGLPNLFMQRFFILLGYFRAYRVGSAPR